MVHRLPVGFAAEHDHFGWRGCSALGVGGCLDLGALLGEGSIDGGRLGGVNLVVVLVGLGEPLLVEQKAAEAVVGAEVVVHIHLDGVEGADFNADLAAHADGDVDIEDGRVGLQLADGVGLLVGALLDEDALGRTLLLADLTGDAAHSGLPVRAIVDQEGKAARSLNLRDAFLGILDRDQPVFADVAAEKVSGSLREAFEDAITDHGWPPGKTNAGMSTSAGALRSR